jgi:hypothetical protein
MQIVKFFTAAPSSPGARDRAHRLWIAAQSCSRIIGRRSGRAIERAVAYSRRRNKPVYNWYLAEKSALQASRQTRAWAVPNPRTLGFP